MSAVYFGHHLVSKSSVNAVDSAQSFGFLNVRSTLLVWDSSHPPFQGRGVLLYSGGHPAVLHAMVLSLTPKVPKVEARVPHAVGSVFAPTYSTSCGFSVVPLSGERFVFTVV